MSKLIAVTGATGAQGGGLVRAILSNPDAGFTARAITRNPGSDAARALAEQGVSVVKADLDDKSSLGDIDAPRAHCDPADVGERWGARLAANACWSQARRA